MGTPLRISITDLGARNPLLEHKSRFQSREISVRRGEIDLHPSLTHRKTGAKWDMFGRFKRRTIIRRPGRKGQESDMQIHLTRTSRRSWLRSGLATAAVALLSRRAVAQAVQSCTPAIPQESRAIQWRYVPLSNSLARQKWKPQPIRKAERRTLQHLSLQRKAGAVQRVSRNGNGQYRESAIVGHSHYRLQLHGRRVWGGTAST